MLRVLVVAAEVRLATTAQAALLQALRVGQGITAEERMEAEAVHPSTRMAITVTPLALVVAVLPITTPVRARAVRAVRRM
jgi:hypothetical protein